MTMFGSSIDFLTHQAKDITQANRHSIARIATGGDAQKLAAMDRKTGNLGKVIRISTDNMSKQDSIRFFQNAMSFMKFQEETILYARKLYSQMYALAQEAESAGITPDEREMLNAKFIDLRQQALDLNNLTFNGKLLFDQFSGAIEYASDISYADRSSFETIEQDFLFNSGILVFDVAPGGGWDKFKLSQVDEDGNENDFFQLYWNSAGGQSRSDLDRFFIEWGPDKETTFRFIPLKEGSSKPSFRRDTDTNVGWIKDFPSDSSLDLDDVYYDNKARYLFNFSGSELDLYNQGENADYLGNRTPYKDSDGSDLGVDEDLLPDNEDAKYRGLSDEDRAWWTDWGFDEFKDTSFAKEYDYLKDQNFGVNSAEEISSEQDRRENVILDLGEGALVTKPITGFDAEFGPAYVRTGRVDPLIPTLKFEHIPLGGTRSAQVRYKFFLPNDVDKINVGNKGDMSTSLENLGLGLLRRGTDTEMEQWKEGTSRIYNGKDGSLPLIDIGTSDDARSSMKALENELAGLNEQMGKLGNNMARVVTSMDAVDKQLGIQQDLVASEPEKVVSQELANLAKAKELRAFNASLMSKVVQINHDMINLLLG